VVVNTSVKNSVLLFLCLLGAFSASAQKEGLIFHSDDKALETAFQRAKTMALSYKGKPGDAVGSWYESALPPRFAFCMRDVSHQALGGQVLGLHAENKNMLRLFAQHISKRKDWCTYWEINHNGKPAPEDYRNDREFWYNLNGSFDVINTCWKLYLWTGDREYIQGKAFQNFCDRTAHEFIAAWVLQPDSLLTRPSHPNAPVPFNLDDAFHRCRGLPSYSEGVPNIKMGLDLVAAIYRGLTSYAEMLQVRGDRKSAAVFLKKALAYRQQIDAVWWDNKASLYNTYYSNSLVFGREEGETFLFWFDALKNPLRKQATLNHMNSNEWNMENLSYFPLIMFENGYAKKGITYMLQLTDPATPRREYPEVSFGVIKGFTEGLMGLEADARYNQLRTIYRNPQDIASGLQHVPVLHTSIAILHQSHNISVFSNTGNSAVNWKAAFQGKHRFIAVDGKSLSAGHEQDSSGMPVSYVVVSARPGKTIRAMAL
jgi:hypothetical protein